MVTLANRVKVSTTTTGTGSITLGSAESGYQSFSDAGLTGSDTVRYTVEDGENWEIGDGSINGAVTQMSRTVIESSNGGSKISLSGAATVFITAAADDIQQPPSEGAFVDGDKTKLDGIEAGADVTDTTNVTAAGALMDSEVTNLAQVKAFDSADYATAAQGSLADSALQSGDNVSVLTNDAGYLTSAGTKDFVASGAIGNGAVVSLNSDGTVSPVEVPYSPITPVEGSPTVFQSGTLDSQVSTVYDPSSQKMVIVYEGGAKVATVSGTSISFGSVASAGFTSVNKAVYDPSSSSVVVFYRTTGGAGEARVGTVSGTSISFGSAVTFASSVAGSSKIAAAYDPSSGKIFVAYKDSGDSNKGKARVGTVSGTSISFGSTATFETAQVEGMTASYDPNEEAVLLVYDDVTNLYAVRACMATISGTSVSFGSKSTIESGNIYATMECEYDTVSQKHGLFATTYITNGTKAAGRVLTVSGSSVSTGSIVTIDSINGASFPSVGYDSNTNRFVFAYKQGNSNDGFYSLVTISGTSMTFTTPAQFESTQTKQTSVGFNVADNRAVIAYIDEGNSYSGTAVVLHTSDAGASNVADWVGIAAESISNAATGAVNLAGSVNSQQSGLTIDATYYVDDTGSLTTTDTGYFVGRAVAADSILLSDSTLSNAGGGGHDFVASGSIGAGQPVVLNSDGTVSVPQQTSQAIGSSQVYESNATPFQAAAFDSASNKVVVFFNENGLGYAVVGTVSGTSITFGSRVQFNNNDAYSLQAVYDDNEGKVVAAFRDDGNSRYGTVIVGTVSGSTITFGAKSVYRSQYLNESSIAYDSIGEKYLFGFSISGNYPRALAGTLSGSTWTFGTSEIIASTSAGTPAAVATADSTFLYLYRDNSASGQGRAYVISLSGTTVSVGGSANFDTVGSGVLGLSYDSASQKVIVAYRNSANDGYCITGTVTGTSVAFGTPAVFNDGGTDYVTNVFDANAGKLVISFRDTSTSNRGTLISGQVSGDTIVLDSPVVFNSSPTSWNASAFDSVSNKVVVAYNDDNPNDGTAIVFQNASTSLKSYNYVGLSGAAYADGATAEIKVVGSVNEQQSGLTGGQAYYVQSDGALSTSPDAALEVYAGLAISSTEILVKG